MGTTNTSWSCRDCNNIESGRVAVAALKVVFAVARVALGRCRDREFNGWSLRPELQALIVEMGAKYKQELTHPEQVLAALGEDDLGNFIGPKGRVDDTFCGEFLREDFRAAMRGVME